ncbi:energy transducer TonB, partial [Corallococcus exercitus]|nr:energy transducer TonB [Corallococcus exercitus]
MSQAVLDPIPQRDRSTRFLLVFLLVSLALHGLAFGYLSTMEGRKLTPGQKPVEMVMVEVQKPPPPPPPEEKKEEPKPPPPPKVKPVKPPPIKVAEAPKPPP